MDFDKLFGEPSNELDEDALAVAAKELFKIYSAFVTAGFTPDQAMSICLTMLKRSLSF